MNSLTAEQLRRNSDSRWSWERYRSHRERITHLILREAARFPCRELCVLGAGNCNDIDLVAILDAGWRLQLIDLDAAALQAGVEQQGLLHDPRLARHGGVDLTGTWDELAALEPSTDVAHVHDLTQRLATARPTYELPTGRLVLSIGLLSQLVEVASLTIGAQHTGFLELVQALRLQHLRLATDLVEPGGTLIATSEIVSSDTAPQIAAASADELPSVVSKLLLEGNFFSGLHPGLIGQTLRTDPGIGPQFAELRVEGPWLWNFAVRTYAVCAFIGHKPDRLSAST